MAPPPPPPPCCAVGSGKTDPATPHHVVLDIPDLEDPIHQRDAPTAGEETGPRRPRQPEAAVEKDGTIGRPATILAVILGILFAACVIGFLVWGIAIGQPKVLMVLPLVAAAVALFFCMLCTYNSDTHPIHTRVDKDDALLLVNALVVAVGEREKTKHKEEVRPSNKYIVQAPWGGMLQAWRYDEGEGRPGGSFLLRTTIL